MKGRTEIVLEPVVQLLSGAKKLTRAQVVEVIARILFTLPSKYSSSLEEIAADGSDRADYWTELSDAIREWGEWNAELTAEGQPALTWAQYVKTDECPIREVHKAPAQPEMPSLLPLLPRPVRRGRSRRARGAAR